ncbi:glycerophosphocholine cholinephosphodiesterase ENPP6-like [Oppia nitens]|uniref:glycerophosphocholine cholinephosphodiesterase ENPP6-like n=1 Tax=Oppia nitens TaxID=1686743 RepID=UPI0023DC2675|nr:glycerophosphocholine cholinephosphodiesterase ENPP6-like [Oppia nitens]
MRVLSNMFSVKSLICLKLLTISVVLCYEPDLKLKESANRRPKTILILADGIRYDYVNDTSLTGFTRIARNGVRAKYVQPIFPANSYPNWYTIITGLYGESHGMVQNYMYDPKEKDMFLMAPHPNASHPHWWNGAEPIWINAEKNGLKTGVYWWDGCQVKIKGKEPTFCLEYQSYWTWPKPTEDTLSALNEILDNFESEEWHLGLIYYEAIDALGHAFGPQSKERIEAVQEFDKLLNSLQDEIEKRNLDNEVNVVVVSDHGMIEVDESKNTKMINIENIVDANDVEVMLDRGTTSFIIPKPNKETKILEALTKSRTKGLKFYKKDEIPVRYHIKNNRRVSPILVMAEKGYFVRGFSQESKTKPVWDVLYGHVISHYFY